MGFGRFRFGRSFGNVNGRMFRGARPSAQYLLNLYRNASAAYSLRTLSRGWLKESVVEVRRSSDDVEAGFTATDVSDGTLTTWIGAGNDGYVTTWYDQSGNGNNAVQNTATSQPKIVENGLLLTDGLNFDGLEDSFTAPDMLNGATNVSMALVTKPTGTNNRIISLKNSAATGEVMRLGISSGGSYYTQLIDGATSYGPSVSASIGSTSILFSNYDASDIVLSHNGTEQTPVSLSNFTINSTGSLNIGKNAYTGSSKFSGFISEIIIYDSDQLAKRTGIEGNINDYYDIFADETYLRPDGSAIFRPDGTSVYERP